ncbi:hypothetical protein DY000_02040272 [Brassica cretica]|uniref:Uncharacterized protein n=1 Tax=Brassica cretica TaxID=69181 RepID=A0ABQ7B6U4_BRACR|nr:hypothetical protein DY000_02040272 [Brassica cretica]
MEEQRLSLDPWISFGTRRSMPDHKVFYLGPRGLFSMSWNRDWGPEAMWKSRDSLFGSRDRGWNPEISMIRTRRSPQLLVSKRNCQLAPRSILNLDQVIQSEEPEGSSLDHEIFDWNLEAIGEPEVTVLRLPRQDYYWYLFGFRILPLGSWPRSCSYDVFYFCRKSLTGLECAGVGIVTQVPGLRCFPRQEKQDLDCSLYITLFSILSHAPPLPLQRTDALAKGIELLFFFQCYPDQLANGDDKDIDEPANEDVLALPKGPMTQSRSKKLTKSIGG